MFPDLCGRGSTAAAVTVEVLQCILSFQTTQRHQASQLKQECGLLVTFIWIVLKTWLLELITRSNPSPVTVMGTLMLCAGMTNMRNQ